MTMLALVGGAVGWHRCVKELFDSVVEPANEAKTALGVESAVDTKHARLAVDPMLEGDVGALTLENAHTIVVVDTSNFTL